MIVKNQDFIVVETSKKILAAGIPVLKLVDGDDDGLPDEARINSLKAV